MTEDVQQTPDGLVTFKRPLIFIPNWIEKRLAAFGKDKKALKTLDDLFSILIPADVVFYKNQFRSITKHPAVAPYFQTFSPLEHGDYFEDVNGGKVSGSKASKRYHDVQTKLMRGADATDPNYYGLEAGAKENNPYYSQLISAPYSMGELTEEGTEEGLDVRELRALLGRPVDDEHVDLINLRVIIDDMDADCLLLRIHAIDDDQSKIPQMLEQTSANIKKITQYYEFGSVMASPIGILFCRLSLIAPNT